MDAKKQSDVLRELVGLDFSKLDAEYKRIYDERTALTREGKSLKGQLEGCPLHDGAPEVEVSVSELAGKLKAIHTDNAKNEGQRLALRNLENKAKDAERGTAVTEQRVSDLKQQLAKAEEQLANAQGVHNAAIEADRKSTRLNSSHLDTI